MSYNCIDSNFAFFFFFTKAKNSSDLSVELLTFRKWKIQSSLGRSLTHPFFCFVLKPDKYDAVP